MDGKLHFVVSFATNSVMRKWLIILLLSGVCSCSVIKKHKMPTKVAILKIEHTGGINGAAVAWDPDHQIYYAAMAGNTYFPMFMYNTEGKRIGDTTMNTMFDVRGLWYNTSAKALQANGYKKFGLAEYVLGTDLAPESIKKMTIPSRQPNEQSAGAFDTGNKVLYFYDSSTGNIIRENFSGLSDTITLQLGIRKKKKAKNHKNSEVLKKYNENACIYTGIAGAEIGLLNAKERQIEMYSTESGLLKKVSQLPPDAPAEYSLNFSCSNSIFWLFDRKKREWRGYR